jgi:putative ATP-binding cassette transporter
MPDGRETDVDASAIAQLRSLLDALRGSPYRRQLGLLAIGIVVVICANTAGQIRLNVWQRDFFNALEQRQLMTFAEQLLVFTVIVGALLVQVVAQTWLHEMLKVRLREWLTHELLDQWLLPKRAHLLAFSGPSGSIPTSACTRMRVI